MNRWKWMLIGLNVLGGIAVLGSYAHGISTYPKQVNAMWGGIPAGLKLIYTISMLTAAAGYFFFTPYFLLRVESDNAQFLGRLGANSILVWYGLVLIPSAMWMPMTFQMVLSPNTALWWAIRLVLFAVGIGSLGLLASLWTHKQRQSGWFHRLAIAGCLAFCVQTALLDAIVWPAYF